MLDKEQDELAQPRGDEVGCVAEEDVAADAGTNGWVTELVQLAVSDRLIGQTPIPLP